MSVKLFKGWVGEVKSRKDELKEMKICIEKFVEWCNRSVEFSNRSFNFFDSLFRELFNHFDDIPI